MNVTPHAYSTHAASLLRQFAPKPHENLSLSKPRQLEEFEGTGMFNHRFPGFEDEVPAATRVEYSNFRSQPRVGLVMDATLLDRSALFQAADGYRGDAVVTHPELTRFLARFDATPQDNIFEPAQVARLAAAYPEKPIAVGTSQVLW